MNQQRIFLLLTFLAGLALFITPATFAQTPEKPFRLPFDAPPGPETWYLGQTYGNTTGAYRQRATTYRNGQGIHFGVDLTAACGTPVVAIGDGIVLHVDGPHGSAPHNVVIEHPNGYSSLYGHLLERSPLTIGAPIKAGDFVGYSGDSQFTCLGSPHLHLEIRDHSRSRLFNPIPLIDADWDAIALIGGNRTFQRNLDDPRQWQYLDEQPNARLQGAFLNAFPNTWPPNFPNR